MPGMLAVLGVPGVPGVLAVVGVLGCEPGEFAAQRVGAVRGHERLVAAVGVAEQRALGAALPEGGRQPPYRRRLEERQVGGEDDDDGGRGVPQPRVERGDGAAAGRLLARPAHRAGGRAGVGDHHGDGRAGAGGQHPVEQRPAADADAGLVGAAEPPGGAPGEHDGVEATGSGGCGLVRGHPTSMGSRGTRAVTRAAVAAASSAFTACAGAPSAAPRSPRRSAGSRRPCRRRTPGGRR